jgi:hypothetical protein
MLDITNFKINRALTPHSNHSDKYKELFPYEPLSKSISGHRIRPSSAGVKKTNYKRVDD